GGSDPEELAQACRIAQDYGYDEVNLNVGCPSDRVQSGSFGACLMKEPDLVARCIEAMQAATTMPVTVKCRIGVDDQREQEALPTLITQVREAGCTSFTVHARKAWLKGLSPKENRTVPPLNYPIVYEMKKQFSDLEIIINGGITTLDETEKHLTHVDGVMMGRAAYETPYVLSQVDQRLFGSTAPVLTRHEIIERFLPYIEERLSQGVPLHAMTRHILGLFHGEKGARAWRRHLSTYAVKKDAGLHTVREALAMIEHIATPEGSATQQQVKV
ncbi:MAG: tRNA dihydrouridine(20/20a) synthase DusA, partial [Parvibaculaceae bacterium]|nr:tRNA dihydrouridine(20/20a) synthase DusA [Parvibaculaceae bacterium]